ncbi:MAG: hypothetical protein U5J96_12445 [Ignavibacteriaceae bacterium]|nr:hypothetical protein [Ignavibacteriaceae bacterium]
MTADGETWEQVDNLCRMVALHFLQGLNCGRSLLVLNDSVYKWDSDILVTSVDEIAGIVDNFLLDKVMNPFNPSTKIRYSFIFRM